MYNSQTVWKVQVFMIPTPNLQHFRAYSVPLLHSCRRKRKEEGLLGAASGCNNQSQSKDGKGDTWVSRKQRPCWLDWARRAVSFGADLWVDPGGAKAFRAFLEAGRRHPLCMGHTWHSELMHLLISPANGLNASLIWLCQQSLPERLWNNRLWRYVWIYQLFITGNCSKYCTESRIHWADTLVDGVVRCRTQERSFGLHPLAIWTRTPVESETVSSQVESSISTDS